LKPQQSYGNDPYAVDWDTGGIIGEAITVTYTNDNMGLSRVLIADDGTTETYNLFGLDLIQQDDGTETRVLLGDALGSARQELVGTTIERVTTYDPYGGRLASQGTSGTTYGFTGEQEDGTTGLVYLRARYYNPDLHLFLSKDPWSGTPLYPQTMHGWTYVENNPVNRVDPTGNQSSCGGTCGPDITHWLREQMKSHYNYGVQVSNFRELMLLRAKLPTPAIPLRSIAIFEPFNEIVNQFHFGIPKSNYQTPVPIGWMPVGMFNANATIEALGMLEYALYGLAVDYSNIQYIDGSISQCGTQGCGEAIAGDSKPHPIVALCGKCVDASDIGNMMFGLGGAARGYSFARTYGSAGTYNVLADWLPSANKNLESLSASFFDADGRGAIVGYAIGQTYAFMNEDLFCAMINGGREIGYNDATTLSQVSQCETCTETATPIAKEASSLVSVSGRDAIGWLKNITGLR